MSFIAFSVILSSSLFILNFVGRNQISEVMTAVQLNAMNTEREADPTLMTKEEFLFIVFLKQKSMLMCFLPMGIMVTNDVAARV